ncbi:porin [Corallococcus exercitus]|uniref:OprO/OprP family phosphate-selective porin n=1 Tax=Corallococcus exercitus TaxID=2316736 RepID=UPI000EA3E03D|nr:porin [Corallococcus exercitus]RKG82037.1 porin [Corallococcus exercitus]
MSVISAAHLVTVGALLFAASPARAQTTEPEKPPEPPSVQLSEEGYTFSTADKAFVLKVRGQLQGDGRFYVADSDRSGTNTFLIRRLRPFLDGTLFGFVDFRLMPDFGVNQPLVQDAYVDLHPVDWLRLRAGRFKTPFGLELLQANTDVPFIERSLTFDLVPVRDAGVQLHGDIAGGRLHYAFAVVNGDPDGASIDVNTDDSFDLVARVFAQPFKGDTASALQGLGLGVAVSRGLQFGTPSTTTSTTGLVPQRSTGQEIIFSFLNSGTTGPTTVADGEHVRLSPQGHFYWGPVGLLAEYVLSSQEVRIGDQRARLRHQAWQAYASYVLGGDASFTGPKPRRPFDPKTGRGGALEISVRYQGLDMDDDAFPVFADPTRSVSQARAFGVATLFAFNRRVRFALNYHRTDFVGGALDGDREAENVVMSRFQVAF